MLEIGQIYPDDDLFFLHMPWRVGLAAISVVMAIRMAALVRWVFDKSQTSRRFAIIRDWPLPALGVLFGLISYWLFVWLSPQFYYFYYMAMYADLPWQVVIEWPPSPVAIVKLLTFTTAWTIADHASGLLGWLLVLRGLSLARKPEKIDKETLLTQADHSV